MTTDLESRVIAVLRAQHVPVLPLQELRARLAREVGEEIAGTDDLYQRLRRRRDVFVVLEPQPVWDAFGWTSEQQEEYRRALREAGIEEEPCIGLHAATADEPPTLQATLRCLAESLALLASTSRGDPEMRALLAETLAEAQAIGRAVESSMPAS